MTIDWSPDTLPPGTNCEPLVLPTPDGAATSGILYRPAGAAAALVCLMHPRVDFSRHYLIPPLVRSRYAVWAQRSRNVNNDLTTLHEQLLLDVATAHGHLEGLGFTRVFVVGNSGGASLYCLYLQQAQQAPDRRLTSTPSDVPVDLSVEMPMPAGLILLAPHPGQGDLLLHCIDPSVTDEDDPASVRADLDLFDPDNGFQDPPESSAYDQRFLSRYRAGQRARVQRIDSGMRTLLAEKRELRRRGRDEGDTRARRLALAPSYVTVHRTDADPRTVDLSLDPSKRDYGSVFGRRPDITNYGAVGFGRLTTPHAWLSTWSGTSSRAALRLTGPDIRVPTLIVSYTADNSVFPADVAGIGEALAADDLTRVDVDGDHYGYARGIEERHGGREAAETIVAWLENRT